MRNVGDVLHELVDKVQWHTEMDRDDAHAAITDEYPDAVEVDPDAAPVVVAPSSPVPPSLPPSPPSDVKAQTPVAGVDADGDVDGNAAPTGPQPANPAPQPVAAQEGTAAPTDTGGSTLPG